MMSAFQGLLRKLQKRFTIIAKNYQNPLIFLAKDSII